MLFTIYLLIHNLAITHEVSTSEKVTSELKQFIDKNQQSDIVVTFDVPSSETLSKISVKTEAVTDRTEKLKTISDALEKQALVSQMRVLDLLKSEKSVKSQMLWITNQLSIKSASAALIAEISTVHEVTEIDIDSKHKITEPVKEPEDNLKNPPPCSKNSNYGQLTYGLEAIKVPEVWSQGYYGQGIVVALMDMGTDVNHDALRDTFVGTSNYGWFDPILGTELPVDLDGHGTHVLGTFVGQNGIGVAPGSRWMACALNDGHDGEQSYTVTSILGCFQHFMCPGDKHGRNRNCSKAPRVINNSWGINWQSPPGSAYHNVYLAAKAFQDTDIFLVFSSGNTGPGCYTCSVPSNYPEIFAVGSTNYLNEVHKSSSGGPGKQKLTKPQVVAPGVDVLSSTPNNTYETLRGTSMASPHVAGIVALMLSKNPNLRNEEIWKILIESTDSVTIPDFQSQCKEPPLNEHPNSRAGYGRINALKAVNNVRI